MKSPFSNLIMFDSLKYKDFRMTWISNMLSGCSYWTFSVGVSWLILKETGNSSNVGIVIFASMLPFLIVSPFAGYISDKYDRKSLAFIMYILNTTFCLILFLCSLFNFYPILFVASIAFVLGTFRTVQEPTVSSLIPNQVPKSNLLNAITLNAATRHGSRFFGLLIVSPFIGLNILDGGQFLLLLSFIFQLSSTYFIYKIKTISSGESSSDSDILSSIYKGIKYIYTNSLVFIIILTVAVHCALVMSYESILPLFAHNGLNDNSGEYLGYLVMVFGAGSLVGNLILSSAQTQSFKSFLFLLSSIGSGVFPIVLGFAVHFSGANGFILSMVGIFFVGACQSSFMSVTTTMVQKIVPDGIRGRIMSLYLLHAGGIMAFGNLILGSLADYIDYTWLFKLSGLAFLVYFFFLFITQKRFRTDIISII
jgi:MFS family permease